MEPAYSEGDRGEQQLQLWRAPAHGAQPRAAGQRAAQGGQGRRARRARQAASSRVHLPCSCMWWQAYRELICMLQAM
jgi:hypothetical protein